MFVPFKLSGYNRLGLRKSMGNQVRVMRAGLPVSRHRRQNNTLRLYTRSPSCCSSPSLAETQQ
ncbi:hypothetical protein QBC45DRAFT_399271 [Copromyces sp. CBS 386.78]|nr:hypothetical protein QBC45DRAFT_399271 [Copromyces sp. CBS 386.78]